jgi:hypothetical protein
LYVKISRIEKRNPAYEKKISQNKPVSRTEAGDEKKISQYKLCESSLDY